MSRDHRSFARGPLRRGPAPFLLLVGLVIGLAVPPTPLGQEAGGGVAAAPPDTVPEWVLDRLRVPAFRENRGQLDNPEVRFYTSAGNFQVGFADGYVLLTIIEPVPPGDDAPGRHAPGRTVAEPRASRGVLLRLRFEGANSVAPQAQDPLPHRTHFFLGSDPARWRTNVPSYREVFYRGLYPGVDLVYRATAQGVKYELRLAPGADWGAITLSYDGADALDVGENGDLRIRTPLGQVRDTAPFAYQGDDIVSCSFTLRSRLAFGLGCVGVDESRPLIIDPLLHSTFLGGLSDEEAYSIAVDASGSAYVTGYTNSTDFPTTPGAFNTTLDGFYDVFVTKLDPTGSGIVYSSYLGGSDNEGWQESIAVDASGSAYVTGYTSSTDFPTTPGAFDTTFDGGGDAFVTKLNATGSGLVYSTFLGGGSDDWGASIAVDATGSAYVTGYTFSTDFPTTPGAFDTSYNGGGDAFVAKLNATGSGRIYSTFLGGGGVDFSHSIAVDVSGSAYVTGETNSTDFPTIPGAFDTTLDGSSRDAFVTNLNATGSGVVYSTFLGGGAGDLGWSIAVDASGSAHVTGVTNSTDFPTTLGAFDTSHNVGVDAFVAKLNATGSGLLYSTFVGGAGDNEWGASIALDATGIAYVTGTTNSLDFPTTPGALDTSLNGGYDAFVSRLDATGSGLIYSTFLGGGDAPEYGNSIAVDASGSAYVAGFTVSADFPTTPGAFDTSYNGGGDAFVAKLNLTAGPNAPPLLTLTSPLTGEVRDQGSSHAVTWTASDNQDSTASLVVFINYTSSAGSGTVCGPVPGSPGLCNWTLPDILADDVVVNGTVIDTGGLKGWDESGPFAIQTPPPNTRPEDYGTVTGTTIVIVGIIIAVLWRLRVLWFPPFIMWCYTKLRRDEVLDNFTRGQIYEYVRLNPGDSYTDIKRNICLAAGPLTYHLAVLEREELVRSVVRGSRKLFYPRGVPIPENGDGLHALQTRILTTLREDPGISVNELAATLGVSRQVALYHVRRLVRADLARLERRVARLRVFPSSSARQ